MDQAHILQLADAIVDELNRQEFSLAFTAERAYLPTFELPDLNEVKITVVPKQDDGKLDTRSSSAHEYALDIGVQMKPPTIDNENLDPLMGLTQEIADFFLFGHEAEQHHVTFVALKTVGRIDQEPPLA